MLHFPMRPSPSPKPSDEEGEQKVQSLRRFGSLNRGSATDCWKGGTANQSEPLRARQLVQKSLRGAPSACHLP